MKNSINILIKTKNHKLKEQLYNEITGRRIPYCSCDMFGEDGISFTAYLLESNSTVDELIELPTKHPSVSVEEGLFDDLGCLCRHRSYNSERWEEIWTIDDAIDDYFASHNGFSPDMLKLSTYRKVYDWEGNQISNEEAIVPFPVERMDESMRQEFEKWKADPIQWEKEKESVC